MVPPTEGVAQKSNEILALKISFDFRATLPVECGRHHSLFSQIWNFVKYAGLNHCASPRRWFVTHMPIVWFMYVATLSSSYRHNPHWNVISHKGHKKGHETWDQVQKLLPKGHQKTSQCNIRRQQWILAQRQKGYYSVTRQTTVI